jgi:hypothetical protein
MKNRERFYLVAEEMSFDDVERELQDELLETFGSDSFGSPLYYLMQVFPDYLVARGPDTKMYRITYTMDDQGEATLGTPQEVEMAYVPVTQEAHFVFEGAAAPEEDGWVWPVQVIKAGQAMGAVGNQAVPHEYTAAVVAEFASAVNGARSGRRHPGPGEGADDPDRIAGWFTDGQLVGESVRAKLHLLKTEEPMRQRFLAAREAKKLDLFNLSVLALVAFKPKMVGGKTVLESTKLGKLISVDLVTEAGAGGRFLPVAASRALLHDMTALQGAVKISATADNPAAQRRADNKGAMMKNRILKVLEALRKHNAGSATTLTTELEALKEEQLPDFLVKVTEAAVDAAASAGTADNQQLVTEAKTALTEAKKLQSTNLIELKVSESKLPAPAASLVREHLSGQIVDAAAIDAEIKRVREAFAKFTPVGKFAGSRIETGLDSGDKVQIAMDKMLGVTESGQKLYAERFEKPVLTMESGVKRFRSIKEAYVFVTGDSDLQFGAGGTGFLTISEATALTTDFPNILLNSMTKRLIQDYAEVGMNGLDMIVSFTDVNDYKSNDRVRLGYLADLATVTEDSGYTDFAKPTDEKISWTATKRGNLLKVTRETILNDDLNKIAAFPSRIARAARRTLKQFITNFLVNNPNYDPDATAVFSVGHNNLGTSPLSIDELIQREIKLGLQTEKDSNKPLGLPLQWLVVPVSLKSVAFKANQSQNYNPGVGIQEPNPFYQRFGANNERIIVDELLDGSDANDWYYGTDTNMAPFLEVGFVQGQREPQIFLQNDPTVGAVFSNDEIAYKVRHEYGGKFIDFRGIGKNSVP